MMSSMGDVIREGMDHYWSVVLSHSDKGLDATELLWKRNYERDMERMQVKYGPLWELYFGKDDVQTGG